MAALLALIPLLLEFFKILSIGAQWWIKLTDEQRKAVKDAFMELKNANDKVKPGSVRHAANRLLDTL